MNSEIIETDVIVIGAGAAGMMCARVASMRGRRVTIIDHGKKIGEKIRISGGGRCNFTNLYSTHENFLSQNPHFCKSALSRFTPQDFLALVESHNIKWHEKCVHPNAKGQLFCDDKSWQIIDMLRNECEQNGTIFKLETSIQSIKKQEECFLITTESDTYRTQSLVVACGGLSIPKIGATGFGYDIAKQFGLNIIPTRAALVPLTFDEELLSKTKELSGISVDAKVHAGKGSFAEGLLFTHKGLSGPSILQVSSYWHDNTAVTVDILPSEQIEDVFKKAKNDSPKKKIQNIIAQYLPQRLADMITDTHNVTGKNMADLSDKTITALARNINAWQIIPNGTEGYRTAEVTIGGVDTKELSSQTMEAHKVSGLYFIGEVVDVTGHLGGHNFQWAWASGHAAGQAV